MGDLGKGSLGFLVGHHICGIHQDQGSPVADSMQTNTPWTMVLSSDDFRSKYSWRSVETLQGGRDPSVIASVMGWSRLMTVLC